MCIFMKKGSRLMVAPYWIPFLLQESLDVNMNHIIGIACNAMSRKYLPSIVLVIVLPTLRRSWRHGHHT